MTSAIRRGPGALHRVATRSVSALSMSAVAAVAVAVALPGLASAQPSTPSPTTTDTVDNPLGELDFIAPGKPTRSQKAPAPGKVLCEDLGLGATLLKVNGAKTRKVTDGDGVRGVVLDTPVDRDGDPDSLFIEVDPGTTATAVVAMHGNRANIWEDSYDPGAYGPFYSPPRSHNTEPPVNHWLVCGPAEESPEPTAAPTDEPSEEPTTEPSDVASSEPGESTPAPQPGGGGSLPVTGVALTGIVLTGLGMVGAGVAMRALRRKSGGDDGDEAAVG